MREYERALAAVMNAYVGKRMQRYFADLESACAPELFLPACCRPNPMAVSCPPRRPVARPVETLLSGPAAGVIGAAFVGTAAGHDRLITLDMGGTSADVAVIEGAPRYSTESQVGDFPVILPAVDVSSIGAGGGSIASTDASGVLKVGPESAGARPGPACYGEGGEHATVTDAYVSLGIIDPKNFLGGAKELRADLARAALARLGARLGLSVVECAEAVLRVATSQMYSALVPLLARKGVDYEQYTLLAFGGGGPCHAFMLAQDVGIRRVMVPLNPGTLCAAGSLAADIRKDLVQTIHRRLGAPGVVAEIRAAVECLTAEGEAWLTSLDLDMLERRQEWAAEMRYVGQSFEIGVLIDRAALADHSGAALRERFHNIYRRLYGYADEIADLEVLDVRVAIVGITPKPHLAKLEAKPADPQAATREIFFDGRAWHAQVFQRADLPAGFRFAGPAIVQQYDTTSFVTPGFTVTVDEYGNMIGEAAYGDR